MDNYTRAQFYDLLHDTFQDPDEYQFYRNLCAQSEGPILELGCGTGRLLVPLCGEGFIVHGIDNNPDMLSACSQKIKDNNIATQVWLQSMQELALDQTYGLIFSALETFQHIVDREHAQEALRRIYGHLKPNGVFCVSLSMPWLYWPDHAAEWREIKRISDSDKTYVLYERSIHDPYTQMVYHYYRVYKNDELIDEYETVLRWYSRYEFEDMLKKAGFLNVIFMRCSSGSSLIIRIDS